MTATVPQTLSPDIALEQAIAHHKAGRLQEAEQLYLAILQAQPGQPDANHNLGVLAGQVGQHAAGLPYLKTALAINPAQVQYSLSYANGLLATGQAREALNILQTAMQRGLYTPAVQFLRQKAEAAALNFSANGAAPTPAEMSHLAAQFNAGRYVELENRTRLLVEQYPDSGVSWKALGASLQAQGKDALHALHKAMEFLPNDAEVHYNLGNALKDLGQLDDAVASYRRALEIKPDYTKALSNLGNALQDLGQLDDAVASYRRALEIKPDFAEAHSNLGNALKNLGQFDDAVANYRRALEIKPDFAEVHSNLGVTLQDLGQFDGAVASYRRALEIKPDFAEAHSNLGNALKNLGQLDDAVANCRRALEIKPDYAEAHSNLGNALQDLGQLDDAVASYRRALQIKPDYAEAHSNLGNALKNLGQLDDAVANCRRALEIKPDFAEAHSNLGNALQALGQLDDATGSFRRALEIKPDYAAAHSNLLFCLSHSETVYAEALFAEHCHFGDQFEAPLRINWPQHANSRSPERRLQVGFVSGDLRNHVVASFAEPVLAHLAGRPQLSLHAYYNHSVEDDVTRRMRGYFPHWHAIASLSDAALAQKILDDGIDILIDLSGHTSNNRLLTFARKPAPIQITWIGYPNTTGLRAMDYVLKDRFNAPYGAYEHYYVEKLVRLPTTGTFLPVEEASPVNRLPALSTGCVTFGSFNRTSKLGEGVIALWSQVLREIPGSRLLLGNVGEDSIRASLAERFARYGVAADRLRFQSKMEMIAYLALHHQVDFILDTFPYTGGTTTNHALWMGVPVLTMSGNSAMQCQSAGMLCRLGLKDWVVDSPGDFVRRAVSWAGRFEELAELRTGMRNRILSSPLRQPETVAMGLETAFRMMWLRWCEGQPTESFEVTLESLGTDSTIGIVRCGAQQDDAPAKTIGQE